MTFRRIRAGLSVLAVFVAPACSDPVSLQERAMDAFAGPLTFFVYDALASPEPGAPQVTLRVETVAFFAISAVLQGDHEIDGDEVTVRLHRVVDRNCPGPCLSIGKRAALAARLPWSEGEYTIRFELAGATVTYRLFITDDLIRVEPVSPVLDAVLKPVITPELDAFWRVPPRSFSLTCGAGAREAVCAELLDALVGELDLEVSHFPEGGPAPAWGYAPHYRYAAEADFLRVAEITCAFARERPDERIGVWARNWQGLSIEVLRLLPGRELTCG